MIPYSKKIGGGESALHFFLQLNCVGEKGKVFPLILHLSDSVDSFLPIVAKSLVRGAPAMLTAKPAQGHAATL